jgi:hypothetical protein
MMTYSKHRQSSGNRSRFFPVVCAFTEITEPKVYCADGPKGFLTISGTYPELVTGWYRNTTTAFPPRPHKVQNVKEQQTR